MDQLDQFAGAAEVAEKRVALLHALRRVAAQGEEAAHPGVEELADQPTRLGVRGAHAGQVRHRVDVGCPENVLEHLEGGRP